MPASIKTAEELEKMRIAGRLTAEVLEMIAPRVEAGITTGELDKICHDYITVTPEINLRSHLIIYRVLHYGVLSYQCHTGGSLV